MENSSQNQTVMVIDDTDDVRELLRIQLDSLGYRVMEAACGHEAIELILRDDPQLILMDLNLPELDGIEVARLIREGMRNSAIIIIGLTALHEAETRQKALAAGCNDYVQKPLESAQLSSLLSRYLPA